MTRSGILPTSKKSLIDNHGRAITYLRLAITDRCNLRCRYCRPENGVPFIPHEEILRFEELERLVGVFCTLGVNKFRVTGGEPFSRRGCLSFLSRLRQMKGVEFLHVTTNGVKTVRFLDELQCMGINGLNLSLDTLDPARFVRITRRDYLDGVLQTLHGALEREISLKINSVVLEETSDGEITRLAGLARQYPLTLRFIEKMPFSGGNGGKNAAKGQLWKRLSRLFDLQEVPADGPTTARIFTVPGFVGRIGIIEGHSRGFCTTCNKLRITPQGMLKACLYDNGVLDLKAMLRSGADDEELAQAVAAAAGRRFANGLETEEFCSRGNEPSMASIGG